MISYKKAHLDQINEIVLRNLTTNESKVKTLTCEISPISTKTVREKLNLLLLHIKCNKNLYLSLLANVSLSIIVLVVAAVAAKLIMADLVSFRIGYGVFNLDLYNQRASLQWFAHGLYCFYCGIGSLSLAINSFIQVQADLSNFFKNHSVLRAGVEYKNSSCLPADLPTLANDSDQESIIDPILSDNIRKDWATSPCFIKIGRCLFSLESVLKQLFSKKLVDGKMRHPMQHGYLSEEEQEKLITDLSHLFQIEKSDITKYCNPYYGDSRKPGLESDYRLSYFSDLQKEMFLERALLDLDLAEIVPDWGRLREGQKDFIRSKLEGSIFEKNRMKSFLKEFQSCPFFRARIQANDGEFFTLEELFNKAEDVSDLRKTASELLT